MRSLAPYLLTGLIAGAAAPPLLPPAPLPPERWTHSALIQKYHSTLELALKEARLNPNGPIHRLYSREYEETSREAAAAGLAIATRGSDLVGILKPALDRPHAYRAEHAVRVSCSRQDGCVVKSGETGSPGGVSGTCVAEGHGLPDGYMAGGGQYVMLHQGLRPQERGLPFPPYVFLEIPLGAESKTNFIAYDPDEKSWKTQGAIHWTRRPAGKAGCQ